MLYNKEMGKGEEIKAFRMWRSGNEMLGLAWVMHQNSGGVQAGKESNMFNE